MKIKKGTKVTTPFSNGIGRVYFHDTEKDIVDVKYPKSKGVTSVSRNLITII